METCSVCDEKEKFCKTPNSFYICGSCVQVLLITDQQTLLNSFYEAEKEGDRRYMWAMRAFILKPPSNVAKVYRV